MNPQEWIEEKTIFKCLSGSHAYGLNTPESDEDIRGVCIPPLDYFFGRFNFEQYIATKPQDITIFNIVKFLDLALDCNPNILELMFMPEDCILKTSMEWEKIADIRDAFLSTKVKHTYSGYSFSQLKRVKTHRSWLLNPPRKKPEREDYDLVKHGKMPADLAGAITNLEEKEAEEALKLMPTVIMSLYQKERAYQNALKHWKQYQNWLKTRNPERAKLEAKFGYDCYIDTTEFLTECGWKLYKDITDEKLATLNKRTKQIEYQIPSNRVEYKYNGDLFEIETVNTACAITENHKCLVSPCHANPKTNYSRNYNSSTSQWELLEFEKLITGYRSNYHVMNAIIPSTIDYPVSDDYLRIMGLYCAEGSLLKYKGKRTITIKGISISQIASKNKIERIVNKITDYTIKAHQYYREEKQRTEFSYNIYDKQLANSIFYDCNEYSENKTLPNWIRFLSERQCRILLDALLMGDGTRRVFSNIYYTTSKQLADKIMELSLYGGFTSKLWDYKDKHGIYQIYIRKLDIAHPVIISNTTKISHITKIKHKGKVVCFDVPNSILITRYKGKIAIQGNSKHMSHVFRLLIQGRQILTTGTLTARLEKPDQEYCRAIRRGKYKYEELIERVENEILTFDDLYENSPLPKVNDKKKVGELQMELLKEHFRWDVIGKPRRYNWDPKLTTYKWTIP